MEAFQSDYASGLVKDLLQKLKSLVIDEAGQVLQFDGKEELEKLEGKLLMAHALLDSLQLPTNNFWQPWVGDVTRVCYDAEDLVDDILLSASNTSSMLERILSFLSRGSMARKILEILKRLEDIIKVLDITHQQARQWAYFEKFEIAREPVVLSKTLFGRDEDKEKIINMLLQSTISSVSIVGIDGLGKTTLCHHVSDDARIKGYFDDIVWVPVNDRFDLMKIILKMGHECEYNFLPENFQRFFQDRYMGKNVLIVLDDLWDVKHKEWSSFSSLLSNSCGCKVLLTTRNFNVAKVTKATPYHLQMLTDEDCALIIDKALSPDNLSLYQLVNLKEVAKAMAQKCKGLPLAADILGLFLSSKGGDDNGDWMMLPGEDICNLKVYRDEIFPVFRLNNPDLTSHLKKCFAYCSLFPYEYNFKRDNMVQLWMAEGYLHPRSLEQIGCEYFDELLGRSIFQLSQLGDNEETPIYKMHEFIHKFADFVASNTCYRFEKDERSCSVPWNKKPRHLSLLCDRIKLSFFKKIEKCETLRTLLLLSEQGTQVGQVPYSLFQKLERLRVLDLSHTDIVELPESLGKLKHLRYLNVSKTHVSRLPISASNLHGLEVLKLRDCSKLLELPKNLKSLTNLIHLDVDINGLRSMPQSIGSLSYLKTLRTFIIGKKEGYRITELKNLNDLGGTICLFKLEKVRDGAEAKEAFISGKPYIKRLKLEWSRFSRNESKATDVLVGLQPHQNLKELHVINYGGSSFPPWLTSPSCMLVRIHVQNCRQYDVLPSLGQLPFLKTLHIEGMYRVKYVDRHFCGESSGALFPSLKSLKIQNMERLELWNELPECSMPQLCDLTVEECRILFSIHSLHHMTSLQALEINRCPWLNSLPELPVSIKSLIIFQSDLVKQQCHCESGPQWCIISSIPKVVIDGDQVVTTDESI